MLWDMSSYLEAWLQLHVPQTPAMTLVLEHCNLSACVAIQETFAWDLKILKQPTTASYTSLLMELFHFAYILRISWCQFSLNRLHYPKDLVVMKLSNHLHHWLLILINRFTLSLHPKKFWHHEFEALPCCSILQLLQVISPATLLAQLSAWCKYSPDQPNIADLAILKFCVMKHC